MWNHGGRPGTQSLHANQAEPFQPMRPEWGRRLLTLSAAGTVGFLTVILMFVGLPTFGDSRPALPRYHEMRRSQATPNEFSLMGPFRTTAKSVAFSWISPGDSLFRSYEVHCSATPRFTPSRLTLFAEPITVESATSIEVTRLQCATTYFFKVRVNRRDGRFTDSSELVGRTGACPDTMSQVWAQRGYQENGWSADTAGYYGDYDEYGGSSSGLPPDSSNDSRSSWYSRPDTAGAYGPTVRGDESGSAGRPFGDGYAADGSSGGNPDGDWSSRHATRDRSDTGTAGRPALLFPPAFITASSADILWSEDYSDQFQSYQVHVSRTPGFRPSPLTERGPDLTSRYRSRLKVDGLQCGSTWFVKVRTTYKDGSTVDSNEEPLHLAPCDSWRGSPSAQGP